MPRLKKSYSFLFKPYPIDLKNKRWMLVIFLISCFISAFLMLFQPWGIALWDHPYKNLILCGYGCVCFVISSIYFLVSSYIIKEEDDWKVWKEMVYLFLLLLFIGLGNFIYSAIIQIAQFNWATAINFMISTFLLGAFPVAAGVLMKHQRFLKANKEKAEAMNAKICQPDQTVREENFRFHFKAENEKDEISVALNDLLYIQSADNYSEIIYLENEKIKKTLLRSSLKRLETQHNNPFLARCHRGFLVNLLKVKHIEGNAQGYKISVDFCEDLVPVSRNYSNSIFEKMNRE